MIALSFASESEANQFYKTATDTISKRSKRRQNTDPTVQMRQFSQIAATSVLSQRYTPKK